MELIQSKKTALISAIMTIVLVQAPHLAWVFSDISKLPDTIGFAHGVLFALSIDLGILYFASNGKKIQTIFFMLVSAAVTVKYYYQEILEAIQSSDYIQIVIILLIAVAPALLIYFISEAFAERDQEEEASRSIQSSLEDRVLNMRAKGATYDQIQDELKVGRSKISNIIITNQVKKLANKGYDVDGIHKKIGISRDKIEKILNEIKLKVA